MPARLSRFALLTGGLVLALLGRGGTNDRLPGLAPARAEQPAAIEFGPHDWPFWRGPTRNGIAPAGPLPPVEFGENQRVLWRTALPGKGHGSPTVVGDQVLLTVAAPEADEQLVVCLDRNSGKPQWQTVVHRGGLTTKGNAKSSLASSSVACDGQAIYASFLNGEAIWLTALDRQGRTLWQTRVTEYALHQGFASSPAVYKNLVYVTADSKQTGLFVAVERATGKVAWSRKRPPAPNYTSPIILTVAGREQLLLTGCDLVTSLDPVSGEVLWEIEGATTECVTSTVTDGKVIFTSGGYPRDHLAAVAADGSGKIVWENKSRVYVPSMIVHDGHLYAVLDAGVAMCWNCADGTEKWKQRLGGTFSASLVLAGDRLYACNEEGQVFVFRATPEKFESLGQNQLGSSVFATPVICGGKIYHRVAQEVEGRRQEFVYCLGE
jgi:outer membrane protein assembly factor BamB